MTRLFTLTEILRVSKVHVTKNSIRLTLLLVGVRIHLNNLN